MARTHEQQLLVHVLLGIEVDLPPFGNGEDLVLEGGALGQLQQGSVHTLTPLLGQRLRLRLEILFRMWYC
jgi:hypothetical protein